jgi:hypothetical protein
MGNVERGLNGLANQPPNNQVLPTQHPVVRSYVDDAVDALANSPPSDYPRPHVLIDEHEFVWNDDAPAITNYQALGRRLAAVGDLYRRPAIASGLIMAPSQPNMEPVVIDQPARFAPIIADRLRVRRIKNGNTTNSTIPAQDLRIMLQSEIFLQQFLPVDEILQEARYLANFELVQPGYTDNGPGQRYLQIGSKPYIERSLDAINKFLDVMGFATNADRTNAVALALTVMLRNHWPGAKPVGIVTSTKSHGGKDTIITFAAGCTLKTSMDYESADWAFRQGFIAALNACPGAGVVVVENARLGKGDKNIASAMLERFLTDSEPAVQSSKHRDALKISNNLVIAISTNVGTVSTDLMNRGLPIHLNPVGNVADRQSSIGNPRLDYLPANRKRIEGELRYMIEKWKAAGRPLDMDVRHPFTDWARTIGGILTANGFTGFLANYGHRRTADDPLREAIGLLGEARPDEWLSPDTWARLARELGLAKRIIPAHDLDTDKSRARGMGVAFSGHRDETFHVEVDDVHVTLRLEKARRRFNGAEASTQYRFIALAREVLQGDDDPDGNAANK